MQIDRLTALWGAYRARQVDMTIHPDDHMHATNGWSVNAYHSVGESGAEAVFAALAVAPTESVWNILDFGCGHGRVARHLRALFPGAAMTFSDADEGAARFCAEQFRGSVAPTRHDFAGLELPGGMDLIWVGSVFTHVSAAQMQHLFDALFRALARDGVLVATFHGSAFLRWPAGKASLPPDSWEALVAAFERDGIAHRPYEGEIGTHGWGVSVIAPERALALSDGHEGARPLAYVERGWANIQDVFVWAKL